MEEVMDFDQFIANYVPEKPEYEAIYNGEGIVVSICPKGISNHIENRVSIDIDIVDQIHAGTLQLHNCFIDLDSKEIEITRQEYLKKIDDIFHRIPEKKFIDPNLIPDIKILYSKKTKKVKFSMTEKLKGKKIRWSGDTVLRFYFTDYNDPHKIVKKIEFTIDQLHKKNLTFDFDLDKRFSVFTRRLLKNYVLDIKS
jgi:hypothetical protein